MDAIGEAERLIANAGHWAEGLTNLVEGEAMDEATLHARRELVEKMERSFYSNLVRLISSAPLDGGIRFWRDGEACLYWRHPSGYEGGLILHRDHRYSRPGEPIPVGSWSVHT